MSSLGIPQSLSRKKGRNYTLFVDYRKLNSVTIKDTHSFSRIDDAIGILNGHIYFKSLDLNAGYWQIRMSEKDTVCFHYCFWTLEI